MDQSSPLTKADGQQMLSVMLGAIYDLRTEMNLKFDSVESRLDARMDGLESRMDSLDARMDGLEIKMELNHHDLVDVVKESTEILKDKHIDHERRIVRLEHGCGLAV